MSETTASDQPVGLRARKRVAAMALIERAAIELALEHGYDSVTVDMICDASSVSPRTFFNYFGSKEGAVLGAESLEPNEEERAAFVASSDPDVVGDLARMLTSVLAEHDRDRAVFTQRRALVKANPSLITKQVARMGEQESKLVELVHERLTRRPRAGVEPAALDDEAAMIVALAGSIIRFSIRRWFASTGVEPAAQATMEADLALARRIMQGRRGDTPG